MVESAASSEAKQALPLRMGARAGVFQAIGGGMARAFELAMVPALFGLAGYGLDRLLGTRFAFAAVLAVLGLFGVVMRTWYQYKWEMAQIEADAPWTEKTPEERAWGGREPGHD